MWQLFFKKKNQFYLHTDHSSYIIELLEGRIPLHACWGKRLEDMPPLVTWPSCTYTGIEGQDVNTELGIDYKCTHSLPLE